LPSTTGDQRQAEQHVRALVDAVEPARRGEPVEPDVAREQPGLRRLVVAAAQARVVGA
jgi:hypothetical protein